MAGTIVLNLQAIHTFQRKFDVKSLALALKDSHLYIISRRPRTRLVVDSLSVLRGAVNFDVEIQREAGSYSRSLTLDLSRSVTPAKFRTHIDGSYFSFEAGDSVIHGDAWALASLSSGLEPDISQQEVVYVGQSFGLDGRRNSQARMRNHETLQEIYSDHAGEPWDIFVTPIAVPRSAMISDDHIDDDEDGPDLIAYHNSIVSMSGKPLKPAIDLAEHALISYFKPSYNKKLRMWRPGSPTVAMSKMAAAGFRLLAVEFSCAELLVRFYSEEQTQMSRGHMILHDLPSTSAKPPGSMRRISAENISSWRFGSLILHHGQEAISTSTELSAAVLTAFGSEAPAVRRPPEVDLSSYPHNRKGMDHTLTGMINSTTGWTSAIDDPAPITEDERVEILRPFPQWTFPTYDSRGNISVRYSDLDTPSPWILHSPDGTLIAHGLIVGPSPKSANLLQQIALEVARSQAFEIVVTFDKDRRVLEALGSWSGAVKTANDCGVASGRELWALLHYRVMQLTAREESRLSQSNPGVVVMVPELADLLADEVAATLALHLLQLGPRSGVSIIVATEHPELLQLLSPLNQALVWAENFVAIEFAMDSGDELLHLLRYSQAEPKSSAFTGQGFEFLVWFNSGGASVGQAVAFLAGENSRGEALSWTYYLLSAGGELDPERLIDMPGHGTSWTTMDALSAQSWSLLELPSGWILVHQYARYGANLGDAAIGKSLSWATSQLESTIHARRFSWEPGPATSDGMHIGHCQLTEILQWRGRAGRSLWQLVGDRIEAIAGPSDDIANLSG